MTDPQNRAVIHIGVSAGEDEPGIDAQFAEGLRRAAEYSGSQVMHRMA